MKINKKTQLGLILLFSLLALSLLVPLLSSYDPFELDVENRLEKPTTEHLFGTDALGRDVFVRIFASIKNSIFIAFTVGITSGILGLILGLLASVFKTIDHIVMRICDALKAVPSLLLAIFLMSIFGQSTTNVIISLTIVQFPTLAIIVRARSLEVKDQDFVKIKYTLGFSKTRVLFTTILPSVFSYSLIHISFIFSSAVLAEAALSFIGTGVSATTLSLGSLLFEARAVIMSAPHFVIIACVFNFLLILSFNLIDDGLRKGLEY